MYSLILLSGGKGQGMHNNIPKQYMLWAGKPIIMHILDRIELIKRINEVIIVCSSEGKDFIENMVKQYNINLEIKYALPGATRQGSVFSGLKLVSNQNVVIHEAARPFVGVEDFNRLLDVENENAMFGIDIPFTVLKGDTQINGILDRKELINVQLPQKFNTKLLLDTHIKAQAEGKFFTEDASMVFAYNQTKIDIVVGKDYNIKITTPMDMIIGEKIYSEYFRRVK